MSDRRDAVIVGGGHNGLVAAVLLAQAGLRVLVLERASRAGGAAVSASPFEGVDVRMSRYSYLVSLFPRVLLQMLGIEVELRPRYARPGPRLEIVDDVAGRLFATLTEPLRPREELRRIVGEAAWQALFEAPLSEHLEQHVETDEERGIVLTDATIGTFAPADDPRLRQNRCFLYHVIGNGTGRWDVPVGGMGALTGALAAAARAAGAEIRTRTEVVGIETDGSVAEVLCTEGERFGARHILAGVAPAVLERLLRARSPPGDAESERPEGSQLKLNMLVRRLPRIRDVTLTPEQAFTGTFHVHESYTQLQRAYAEAEAGRIPELPPCEIYCHSLTDPSILGEDLRRAGAQTLTLFGLHMPARLFAGEGEAAEAAKEAAVAATLRSLDSVLAEPIEDCLWLDREGRPCLEALTPADLEAELGMPGGHIFHRDMSWPYAATDEEVGKWGVETGHANVWICGAGARRGGGVSGIPGHNAARAVLAAEAAGGGRSRGNDGSRPPDRGRG
ncbi:MAG: NAD(P)/FAD-dependent oxidoreductase [Solirubrobacterales bacterium]|nr:NAD(P)/FAD-dependent oxidoreductase [Solirubrobacterales bacterium]